MALDLLRALAAMSWISSAAIVVLLLVRSAMRGMFGAQLAYLAWVAVPVTLLVAILPVHANHEPLLVAAPLLQLATYAQPLRTAAGAAWGNWVVLVWAFGSAGLIAWFWRDHTRFLDGLGQLVEKGGIVHTASESGGPAIIGIWRPRIIVPSDFSTRYTAHEQSLILAHEREHARRRDPACNAICALIQCVFWFNPLVHLAARRFRFDQELACDTAVMGRHPGMRRTYADAMLKTQVTGNTTLVACNWQSNHPLKERIMHLQKSQPLRSRRFTGRLVVAALVCASAYGALSANASPDGVKAGDNILYQIDMELTAGGVSSSTRVQVHADEPFAVASTNNNARWRGEFLLRRVSGKTVKLESVIKQDDKVTARPALMMALGEQAGVTARSDHADDGFDLRVTVAQVALPAPKQR